MLEMRETTKNKTMNDLSKTPSAELVGEYENLMQCDKRHWITGGSQRAGEISQELDRRCEAAGMEIQFGTHLIFKKASSVVSNYPYPEWKISMEASELHALLGWLLMKGK